jgi:hypothetical protein
VFPRDEHTGNGGGFVNGSIGYKMKLSVFINQSSVTWPSRFFDLVSVDDGKGKGGNAKKRVTMEKGK